MSGKGSTELSINLKCGAVYPSEKGAKIPPDKAKRVSEQRLLGNPKEEITIPVQRTNEKEDISK